MITRINQIVGVALSYVYALVAILTFVEVCRRYFFNAPSQWSIEVVILLAALHYIMSGAQAYANDTHIRITVVYDRLPARVRWVMRLLERVLVATVAGIVAVWAYRQADFAIEIGERSGSNWNTPSPMILKAVVFVGLVMIVLQAIEHLIRDLRRRDDS